MINNRLYERIYRVNVEHIFLAGYVLFMFESVVFCSQFMNIDSLRLGFSAVRLAAYTLVCLKIMIDVLCRRYTVTELFLISGITSLLVINAKVCSNKNPLIFWMFIIAAHDIKLSTIIKHAFIGQAAALVFVISCRLSGLIPESIFVQDAGERVRYSLGFRYSTDIAHYVIYMLMFWVFLRQNHVSIAEILGMLVINYLIYYFTDTRSTFWLGNLLIIADTVLKFCTPLRRFHKGWVIVAVFIVPLCAFLFFFVSAVYSDNNSLLSWLNGIINGRLQLTQHGIQEYGIHLLGQPPIDFHGGAGHNILDSSYAYILVQQGAVLFVLVLIWLELIALSIIARKDIYHLLVFCVIAVHSTFDFPLIEFGHNAFLLSYAPIMAMLDEDSKEMCLRHKKKIILALVETATVVLLMLSGPVNQFIENLLLLEKRHPGYYKLLSEYAGTRKELYSADLKSENLMVLDMKADNFYHGVSVHYNEDGSIVLHGAAENGNTTWLRLTPTDYYKLPNACIHVNENTVHLGRSDVSFYYEGRNPAPDGSTLYEQLALLPVKTQFQYNTLRFKDSGLVLMILPNFASESDVVLYPQIRHGGNTYNTYEPCAIINGANPNNYDSFLVYFLDKSDLTDLTAQDWKIFVNTVTHDSSKRHAWISLLFNDGTGLQIQSDDPTKGIYGMADPWGRIIEKEYEISTYEELMNVVVK